MVVDTYFAFANNFFLCIEANVFFPILLIERESSVDCRQFSDILLPTLFCLLVFHDYVSENDSSHAV